MDRIFIQSITMTVIVAIVVVQIVWLRRYTSSFIRRERLLFAIPILVWMAHGLLFYTLVILSRLVYPNPFIQSFGDWSSILRLHGLISVLALEVAHCLSEKEDTIP